VTSKAARRPPDINDLSADREPFAIPVDLRISNDLALLSPAPPALFRRGKVASTLQRTDLDAPCLLDGASSASPIPAHIEILWKFSKLPLGDKSMTAHPIN
jgi:hypothetical protein